MQWYRKRGEGHNDYKVMHDTSCVMRYFKSEQEELARIREVEKDYAENSLMRKVIGKGDPLYIGNWRFDHPAAFDLLIRFLREDRLEYYTKIAVLGAIRKTPHLPRYRSKSRELRSIFENEKRKKGNQPMIGIGRSTSVSSTNF